MAYVSEKHKAVDTCFLRIREAEGALADIRSLVQGLIDMEVDSRAVELHVSLNDTVEDKQSKQSSSVDINRFPSVSLLEGSDHHKTVLSMGRIERYSSFATNRSSPVSPKSNGNGHVSFWERSDAATHANKGMVDQIALCTSAALAKKARGGQRATRVTGFSKGVPSKSEAEQWLSFGAAPNFDDVDDDDTEVNFTSVYWVPVLLRWPKGPLVPIIHPECFPRVMWLLLGAIMLLHEALAIPVLLCFDIDPKGVFLVFAYIVTIYFICDMMLSCFTAVENEFGDLTTRPAGILKKYARGWLSLDALSTIPWDWFAGNRQGLKLFRFIRVIRLVRLTRIVKIQQALAGVQEASEGSRQVQFVQGLLVMLLPICMVCHWLACFWYMVGRYSDNRPNWFTLIPNPPAGPGGYYMWSLYFTLVTMFTVGYGDIHVINEIELAYSLGMLPVSALLYTVVLGSVSDLINNHNRESRIKSDRKMELGHYLKYRKVPSKLRRKVRTRMNFAWEQQGDSDMYGQELIDQLPQALGEELCFHIYGRMLSTVPILTWLRGYKVCLRRLAGLLCTKHLEYGDYLFRLGQLNDTVYMLRDGRLWITLKDVIGKTEEKTVIKDQDQVEEPGPLTANRRQESEEQSVDDNDEEFDLQTSFHAASAQSRWNRASDGSRSNLLQQAGRELSLYDETLTTLAIFVQRRWRAKKAAMNEDSFYHVPPSNGFKSHSVAAPAYLGESCLWVPYADWADRRPPTYSYNARCEQRCEIIIMPRMVVANLLEQFSPWLPERFESYRRIVRDLMTTNPVATANSKATQNMLLPKGRAMSAMSDIRESEADSENLDAISTKSDEQEGQVFMIRGRMQCAKGSGHSKTSERSNHSNQSFQSRRSSQSNQSNLSNCSNGVGGGEVHGPSEQIHDTPMEREPLSL